MKKKPTKKTATEHKVSAVEVAAQREAATLRRLRAQQRAIVKLSRDLTRAVRRADGARLDAARELCADTGFVVVGIAEWDILEKRVAAANEEATDLRNQLDVAEAAGDLAPAKV